MQNIKAVAPKLGGDGRTNHVSISARTNRGKLTSPPNSLSRGHKNVESKRLEMFKVLYCRTRNGQDVNHHHK